MQIIIEEVRQMAKFLTKFRLSPIVLIKYSTIIICFQIALISNVVKIKLGKVNYNKSNKRLLFSIKVSLIQCYDTGNAFCCYVKKSYTYKISKCTKNGLQYVKDSAYYVILFLNV